MSLERKAWIAAVVVGIFWLAGIDPQSAVAQQVSYEHATPQQLAGIVKDNSRHFGDDPDDGGPIATDLSASLDPAAVGMAMRKVADWQLTRSQEYFDRIWTWSVLYASVAPSGRRRSEHRPSLSRALSKKERSRDDCADSGGAGRSVGSAARLEEAGEKDSVVVVRCLVHGPAGMVANVCGYRRSKVHRVSG